MADNLAVTAGSGTTVAADDIGGVLYQRVKLALGADGTGVDAGAGSGVNGTSVQRVTIATDDSWLKAEDAAHTSGNVGVMSLAVRQDTPGALATTDGDYIPLTTNASGALYVVDATQAALAKAEDAAHTTADVGVMSLAVRQDADAALAGTTLDYIPLTTNSLGHLKVTVKPAVVVRGVSGVPVTGDLTTLTSVTDAPTGGQKIVIDEIVFGGATAAVYTFTEETSGTVVFVASVLAGDSKFYVPAGKIKLATADKKLQVDASAGTAHSVTVSYHSEA